MSQSDSSRLADATSSSGSVSSRSTFEADTRDGVPETGPRTTSSSSATRLRIGLAMFAGGLVGIAGGMSIVASRPDPYSAIRSDLARRPSEERVQLRQRLNQLAAADNQTELLQLAETLRTAGKPIRDAAAIYTQWEQRQPDNVRALLQNQSGGAKIDALRTVLSEAEEDQAELPGNEGDRPAVSDQRFDTIATRMLTLATDTDGPLVVPDDPIVKMLVAVDRLSGSGDPQQRADTLVQRLRPELDRMRNLFPEPGGGRPTQRGTPDQRIRIVAAALIRQLSERLNDRLQAVMASDADLRTTLAELPDSERIAMLTEAPSQFRRSVAYSRLVSESEVPITLDLATLRELQDRLLDRRPELWNRTPPGRRRGPGPNGPPRP